MMSAALLTVLVASSAAARLPAPMPARRLDEGYPDFDDVTFPSCGSIDLFSLWDYEPGARPRRANCPSLHRRHQS